MIKRLFWAAVLVALIQLSPLITETPKFFCDEIGAGLIQCGEIKFEEKTFFFVRLTIIITIIVLFIISQYFQTYRPLKKYSKARNDVFDALLAPSLDNYMNQGFSLRINVMKAQKPLRYLFLCHKLEPIYHYGFEPKHRDSHLSFFVCRFLKFAQGNCGEAFLTEEPQLADLAAGVAYEYNMPKSKIEKTDYIKGIISIPVFELMNRNSAPKVVGVINIDTNDEELVRDWVEDQECLSSIIDAFENHAKIVSHFI